MRLTLQRSIAGLIRDAERNGWLEDACGYG